MADISMCKGEFCSKRDTCYRYLAKADRYQAYFIIPKEEQGNKCKVYWEDKYGTTNLWSNSDR